MKVIHYRLAITVLASRTQWQELLSMVRQDDEAERTVAWWIRLYLRERPNVDAVDFEADGWQLPVVVRLAERAGIQLTLPDSARPIISALFALGGDR